jgi:hypothetical protein
MEKQEREELEQMIEKTLTVGEMDSIDPQEGAKAKLNMRYEIPVKAEYNPVTEETRVIRSMAKEPDNRYDRWMKEEDRKK